MRESNYQLSLTINAPWDKIYAFVADLPNHAQIHPLIVGIREVGRPEMHNGFPRRYFKIRDRLLIWKIPLYFSYSTITTLDPPYQLVAEAYQFPRVSLHNTLRCEPDGMGAKVSEKVVVRAPNLLHNYVVQQAKAAHWQSFLRLKAIFEES